MQIDWFEIIAQIINFFIMLFVLQKLLYKPVLHAMAERQKRIQKSQIEADERMQQAEKLIVSYNGKIADIHQEERDILEKARQNAQENQQNLLEDYKKQAENKRTAYLKEIEDEKESFINNLKKNLGRSAVKIAENILRTISSKDLEEQVFNTFVANLKNLKRDLPDDTILKEESHLSLSSSRVLSEKQQKIIEDTLSKQIENLQKIHYEVDPDLVLGYELNLETYTIHTNIKNYLNTIEKDIIKNLETN